MKQVFLFFGLTVLVLIPFFIWGDAWEERFTFQGAISWLNQYGSWAWFAGIILLVLDLVLPIPGSLVMSGLGYVYGFWTGGLLAAFGSFLSGSFGYWICRSLGEKAARRLLGDRDFEKGVNTFNRVGGWLVVLSRWLPVFPEVIACMAGLNRMSRIRFHLALLASALPMGFVFAYIGDAGVDNPVVAVVLSAFIPPVIWLVLTPIFKKQENKA